MNKTYIALADKYLSNGELLEKFMPISQRFTLKELIKGEEGYDIAVNVLSIAKMINEMPKTYETDSQGLDAIVYLHYFGGSVDAWVTERDVGDTVDQVEIGEQYQAFGKVCLTGCSEDAELGYISIAELIENNIELDLHWTPRPLKEV